MRVIITGSRTWEGIWGTERINQVLLAVELLSTALNSPLEIVHGNCPTGADAIADRWARRRGYEPILYHALWGKAGKGAGLIRNTDMANGGGDLCLAFLRDGSRGTTDMLTKAKAQGIPTFVIDWNQRDDMASLNE